MSLDNLDRIDDGLYDDKKAEVIKLLRAGGKDGEDFKSILARCSSGVTLEHLIDEVERDTNVGAGIVRSLVNIEIGLKKERDGLESEQSVMAGIVADCRLVVNNLIAFKYSMAARKALRNESEAGTD